MIGLDRPYKVVIGVVTAFAVLAFFSVVGTAAGPCIDVDEDTGNYTYSKAEAYVYIDYTVQARASVKDIYIDEENVLARFVVIVDGNVVIDVYRVVDDGSSATINWIQAGSHVKTVAEGLAPAPDSRAEAEAYWSRYCPLCVEK